MRLAISQLRDFISTIKYKYQIIIDTPKPLNKSGLILIVDTSNHGVENSGGMMSL